MKATGAHAWLAWMWAVPVLVALLGCEAVEVRAATDGQAADTAAAPDVELRRPPRSVKVEAYAYYAEGVLLDLRSRRLQAEAAHALFLNGQLREAKRRQAAQLWVQAREALEKAVELDPQGVAPVRHLSFSLAAHGDFQEAIPYLERLVELDPDDYQAHDRLGLIYEQEDRIEDALDQYRLALSAAHRDDARWLLPRLHARLAVLTEQLHGLAAAVGPLAEALDYSPQDRAVVTEVERVIRQAQQEEGFAERAHQAVPAEEQGFGFHYLLGRVAFARQEWSPAAEHMGHVVESRPLFWPGYLYGSLSLGELGREAEAVALLEEARGRGLDRTRVQSLIGSIELARGRYEEARAALEEAVRLAPKGVIPRFELALAYAELDMLDEAVEQLEENRKNAPRHGESLKVLGFLYTQKGDYQQARARFWEAVRVVPDDLMVRTGLAGACEKLGLLDEAVEQLKLNLEKDPDHAPSLNNLGYLYAERNVELEEAERLVRQALAQEPENGAYLDSLGWVFFRQGKLEEALDLLSQAAAKLGERDPVVYDHLGEVHRERGELKEAARRWEQALELDPEADAVRQKLQSLTEPGRPEEKQEGAAEETE